MIKSKFQSLRNAAVVGAMMLATSVFAQTTPTNPATGIDALNSLNGSTTQYGPPLFALAVVATGIMIALAWIKKARGAAR